MRILRRTRNRLGSLVSNYTTTRISATEFDKQRAVRDPNAYSQHEVEERRQSVIRARSLFNSRDKTLTHNNKTTLKTNTWDEEPFINRSSAFESMLALPK